MSSFSKLKTVIYSLLALFITVLLTACPEKVDIKLRFKNDTDYDIKNLRIFWPPDWAGKEEYLLFSGDLGSKQFTKYIQKNEPRNNLIIRYKVNNTDYEVYAESVHTTIRSSAEIIYNLYLTNPSDPGSMHVRVEILNTK